MKRIISALIALLVAVAYASAAPKAPKYKNKQLALFYYTLTADQASMAHLNQYKSQFEADPKVDPIEKALRYRIFDLVKSRLESEIGLGFLPIESFQSSIDYDKYGFPSGNINKVIRLGNSKLYFKLDVTISSASESGNATGMKPTVSIVLTVFNNKGIIPVDKFQGVGKASDALQTNAALVNGLANDKPIDEKGSLMNIANDAVSDLIINML